MQLNLGKKKILKSLKEQVVVIHGATSNVGAFIARHFVDRGARLILTAPEDDELRGLEIKLLAAGGRVSVVEADMAVPGDVRRIAHMAMSRYGTIDTWINLKAPSAENSLSQVNEVESRKSFDADFWEVVKDTPAATFNLIEMVDVETDHPEVICADIVYAAEGDQPEEIDPEDEQPVQAKSSIFPWVAGAVLGMAGLVAVGAYLSKTKSKSKRSSGRSLH